MTFFRNEEKQKSPSQREKNVLNVMTNAQTQGEQNIDCLPRNTSFSGFLFFLNLT